MTISAVQNVYDASNILSVDQVFDRRFLSLPYKRSRSECSEIQRLRKLETSCRVTLLMCNSKA